MAGRRCELPVQAEVHKDTQKEDAQEAPQRCENNGQVGQLEILDLLGAGEFGLEEGYLLPLIRVLAGWAGPSINSLRTLAHHGLPSASVSSVKLRSGNPPAL